MTIRWCAWRKLSGALVHCARDIKNYAQTNGVMRRVLCSMPWLFLWGAFFLFGIWLNSQWQDGVARFQVHGYDYSDYMWFLSDWREIFYPRPRHPLFGALIFPIAVMCGCLKAISSRLCFWVINAFFAGIMTACSFLVARISKGRFFAAILYASFASTMLLGGMPESFGLSALVCLVALKWLGEGTLDGRRYVVVSIVAGGLTVTQGVKLLMMRFVVGSGRLKERCKGIIVVGLWCVAIALAIGLLFVAVHMVRKWANPEYSRTLANMFRGLGTEFSYCDLSWGERLNRWWVYVSEPILTRGTPLGDNGITTGYSRGWQAILLMPLYVVSVIGAWLSRYDTIAKAMLNCLVVDFMIHFVCGWGMHEPHLYAGHWTFALPIFVFLAIQKMKYRPLQRVCSSVVAVYGIILATLNLQAFGII